MNDITNIKIDELDTAAISAEPVPVDWQEVDEEVEAIEAAECPECGIVHVVTTPVINATCADIRPDLADDDDPDYIENECSGSITAEGPMMGVFYPIRIDDPEETARAIGPGSVCVVSFEESGKTGLALTGGGMDLSWDICRAHILAGYLPPLRFCDLPDLAGWEHHPSTEQVLRACERSAQCAADRAARVADRVREMERRRRAAVA